MHSTKCCASIQSGSTPVIFWVTMSPGAVAQLKLPKVRGLLEVHAVIEDLHLLQFSVSSQTSIFSLPTTMVRQKDHPVEVYAGPPRDLPEEFDGAIHIARPCKVTSAYR